MRYIILITCLVLSHWAISQSLNKVDYSGGFHKLNALFGGAYAKNVPPNPAGIGDSISRYFEILFTLNTRGQIEGPISFTFIGDTTKLPPFVISTLKQTEGKWINNSGHKLRVVLSFALVFEDPDLPERFPLQVRTDFYDNWQKQDVIRIPPIIFKSYPAVTKRN